MKRGDLVEIDEKRWLVCRVEATKALLIDPSGKFARVRTSLPRAKILANPTRDWPFVVINSSLTWGKLRVVGIPNVRGPLQELQPFSDWLWGEPLRTSGALYLNPALGLKPHDRIVLDFERRQTGVPIPVGFGTLQERVARTIAPPPERRRTIYDRLLDGGDEDE